MALAGSTACEVLAQSSSSRRDGNKPMKRDFMARTRRQRGEAVDGFASSRGREHCMRDNKTTWEVYNGYPNVGYLEVVV